MYLAEYITHIIILLIAIVLSAIGEYAHFASLQWFWYPGYPSSAEIQGPIKLLKYREFLPQPPHITVLKTRNKSKLKETHISMHGEHILNISHDEDLAVETHHFLMRYNKLSILVFQQHLID